MSKSRRMLSIVLASMLLLFGVVGPVGANQTAQIEQLRAMINMKET